MDQLVEDSASGLEFLTVSFLDFNGKLPYKMSDGFNVAFSDLPYL
jgi:hypothetical protein